LLCGNLRRDDLIHLIMRRFVKVQLDRNADNGTPGEIEGSDRLTKWTGIKCIEIEKGI
jgi:hypothetical protein